MSLGPRISGKVRGAVDRVRRLLDPLLGSRAARERQRRFLAGTDLRTSLGVLPGGTPADRGDEADGVDGAERPIFVLAAGWRSGSTLVQRLLMSGGSTLIWGEPFGRSCLVQRLTETLRPFGLDYPPARRFLGARGPDELSEAWVANLYPPLDALRASYRGLLDRLYGDPATAAGATRWGLKEVRFGEDEARFLRWLYPGAVFVFLVRDPADAYRSYVRFSRDRDWYGRWPTGPAFTPGSFGRHWAETAASLAGCADELGALFLRYEELIEGGALLRRLETHVGVEVRDGVLEARVGTGTLDRDLGWLDRLLLRRSAGRVATKLGY